jgi:hypothetical protein
VPILLQVHQIDDDDSHNKCKEHLTLFDNRKANTRWEEICQKIRVNQNLDGDKKQHALTTVTDDNVDVEVSATQCL